jgi:hypothetical protein
MGPAPKRVRAPRRASGPKPKELALHPDSWVGFDLDGTLAVYPYSFPEIGPPIPVMVGRVKQLLAAGIRCKIFTGRVCLAPRETGSYEDQSFQWFVDEQRARVERWCKEHIGTVLEVTAEKDLRMIALFDDRAIAVETNTGLLLQGKVKIAGLVFI